jgi:hypothetical protein
LLWMRATSSSFFPPTVRPFARSQALSSSTFSALSVPALARSCSQATEDRGLGLVAQLTLLSAETRQRRHERG